jgi:hypothetical protein
MRDSNGLVEGGNIKFKEIDDIYIIEETLNITITRDHIDVKVEYLLSNQGQERAEVCFSDIYVE